ncbi:MAG TPA: hypothetical protein VKT70_00355 [Stellaceae bacterium]|nr:hypothetical protein [Stellaceae bacterium]
MSDQDLYVGTPSIRELRPEELSEVSGGGLIKWLRKHTKIVKNPDGSGTVTVTWG